MIFTPPPPVTNCHTFSDPSPLWSVTYFMDGPIDVFHDVWHHLFITVAWRRVYV